LNVDGTALRGGALWRACGSLLGLLLAAACYEFPDPDLGVCGNRIIEPGEDCDDPDDRDCGTALSTPFAACRLICNPAASSSDCPPDRQCGQDGICRAPAGTFGIPLRIDVSGTQWLEIGDVDGDRRADIVVGRKGQGITLVRIDEGGDSFTTAITEIGGRAAVDELTADDHDDIFVSTLDDGGLPTGVALFPGAPATESPAPAYFATLRTDGVGARLLSPSAAPGHTLELVSPSIVRQWSATGTDAEPLAGPAGIDPSELAIAMAVADIDEADDACEGGFARTEVALVQIGASAVQIASTCGGGADPVAFDFAFGDVLLPAGETLGVAGTFFAHADAGGVLDLVTQTSSGQILAAYGDGDGGFHGATPAEAPGDGRFSPTPLTTTAASEPLLAVADIDADGALELVTSTAFVRAAPGCTDSCATPWSTPWSAAAVVDINDDGVTDLVGLHDDAIEIVLVEVDDAGEVSLLGHTQRLAGPASTLAVGDFDRDTRDDVASIERNDATGTDSVAVIYGGPSSPWTIARYGPFLEAQALAVEADRTAIVRALDGQGRPAGAFVEPDDPRHDFGIGVHRAVVAHSAGATLVAAVADVADGGDARLGIFAFAGGTLSPHDVHSDAILDGMPASAAGLASILAIDLDGDPVAATSTDEIVVLGTTGSGGGVWVASSGPLMSTGTRIDFGPGFATAAAGDADGDGDDDIVATTEEQLPRVVVLRNDGGELSTTPIELEPTPASFANFRFRHIVAWHSNSDNDTARWLVASEDRIALAEIDLESAKIRLQEVAEVAAVTAIGAADVDGDGLLDFVVGTANDIRIYPAQHTVRGD